MNPLRAAPTSQQDARADRPVLVTGAAGFVGSHLCDRLVERGAVVIGLDNLSSGHIEHISGLRGHARFHFERHDVTEPLPQALREAGAVYNLACPASPAYYQRHPIDTLLASTLGSWRVLELAAASGARVLQASTSEVYGDPEQHPQHEDYWGHVNPIGPRSCYDEGKRAAEAMCYAYARERGLTVRVARLFNCYGPRLRPGDGRVVSNFIEQALAGRPLTVYGDGRQTRSFCYVSDTVRALQALMSCAWDGPVNIGNPREHTMLELADAVRAATDSSSALQFRPLPQDDPVRRRPDIERVRRVLGWQPEVPLAQGLQLTIAHFRESRARDAAPADPAPAPPA